MLLMLKINFNVSMLFKIPKKNLQVFNINIMYVSNKNKYNKIKYNMESGDSNKDCIFRGT